MTDAPVRRTSSPGRLSRGRVAVALALVVALVVAVVVVVGGRAWLARAPFGPDAVQVQLRSSVVVSSAPDAADIRADLDALTGRPGVVFPQVAAPGSRYVVGQVTIRAPRLPHGAVWALVAVDRGSAQGMHEWASDSPISGSEWHGSWSHQLGDRYDWLSALRDRAGSSGVTNPALALAIPGGTTRPVTFAITSVPLAVDDTGYVAGSGDPGASTIGADTPLSMAYVTLALVLVKPDGEVWWAKRLLVNA